MRRLIYFIVLFAGCGQLKAQNADNHMVVQANTALNFMITSPADLETEQVLPNAIKLSVKSKQVGCSIFARLSNFTAPAGYYSASSPLALEWSFDTSNKDYDLNKNKISLSASDVFLFSQKKKVGGGNDDFDYYYNLILDAPGYNFVPGTYNFTILFTMTQP